MQSPGAGPVWNVKTKNEIAHSFAQRTSSSSHEPQTLREYSPHARHTVCSKGPNHRVCVHIYPCNPHNNPLN